MDRPPLYGQHALCQTAVEELVAVKQKLDGAARPFHRPLNRRLWSESPLPDEVRHLFALARILGFYRWFTVIPWPSKTVDRWARHNLNPQDAVTVAEDGCVYAGISPSTQQRVAAYICCRIYLDTEQLRLIFKRLVYVPPPIPNIAVKTMPEHWHDTTTTTTMCQVRWIGFDNRVHYGRQSLLLNQRDGRPFRQPQLNVDTEGYVFLLHQLGVTITQRSSLCSSLARMLREPGHRYPGFKAQSERVSHVLRIYPDSVTPTLWWWPCREDNKEPGAPIHAGPCELPVVVEQNRAHRKDLLSDATSLHTWWWDRHLDVCARADDDLTVTEAHYLASSAPTTFHAVLLDSWRLHSTACIVDDLQVDIDAKRHSTSAGMVRPGLNVLDVHRVVMPIVQRHIMNLIVDHPTPLEQKTKAHYVTPLPDDLDCTTMRVSIDDSRNALYLDLVKEKTQSNYKSKLMQSQSEIDQTVGYVEAVHLERTGLLPAHKSWKKLVLLEDSQQLVEIDDRTKKEIYHVDCQTRDLHQSHHNHLEASRVTWMIGPYAVIPEKGHLALFQLLLAPIATEHHKAPVCYGHNEETIGCIRVPVTIHQLGCLLTAWPWVKDDGHVHSTVLKLIRHHIDGVWCWVELCWKLCGYMVCRVFVKNPDHVKEKESRQHSVIVFHELARLIPSKM